MKESRSFSLGQSGSLKDVRLSLANTTRKRLKDILQDWSRPEPFDWRAALACLLGGLALWPLTARLPVVGWDWYYWFHAHRVEFYPPWTELVLSPLNALTWRSGLALLNALMLMAVAVGAAKAVDGGRLSRLGAVLLALLTPPVFMALWLGNIEGLVLLGLVALPPGVVLALMKPNLTLWAMLARRRWLFWSAALFLGSLLVWGWWPARTFSEMGRLGENPMTIGWYNLGWPVGLLGAILLLLSNADPLRLMAAGFLVTPYLMPNHSLLLLPALGRVTGWKRLILWGLAWVSGIASGMNVGPGRYLGLAFPLAVWWLLKNPESSADQQEASTALIEEAA